MHIKSQINKTTIYFCSRCYGYLTMDVKFKNRKKDLGGVSKLKQQVQRYAFCLHSKWCSEVKGHTCTRLHQEVGRRRQWGGGGGEGLQDRGQGGHSSESRQRTISSSVRYSFPPSDKAMMLFLYPPIPDESTSCQKPHTRTVSGHKVVHGWRKRTEHCRGISGRSKFGE